MAFPRFRKFGIVLVAGLIAAAALYLGIDAALDWRSERLMDDRADAIIALMNISPQADFQQTVDTVRVFINDDSQDKVDAVFWAMNGTPLAFADGIIEAPLQFRRQDRRLLQSDGEALPRRLLPIGKVPAGL